MRRSPWRKARSSGLSSRASRASSRERSGARSKRCGPCSNRCPRRVAFRDFLLDDASERYQVTPKDAHSAIATYFSQERDGYAWRWLSFHLAKARRTLDLRALLWDPDYLAGKMAAVEPSALLADFDYVPNDVALQLVRGALRLSAAVLMHDPAQFAAQMIGRLMPYGEDPAIGAFSSALGARAPAVWLRPLGASLQAPGGPMLYTLRGHRGDVTGERFVAQIFAAHATARRRFRRPTTLQSACGTSSAGPCA